MTAQASKRRETRKRMRAFCASLLIGAVLVGVARPARADGGISVTNTWYQERRIGPLGGLTVLHPQANVAIDAGDTVTVAVNYSADVVSGATAAVYSVDAVSSATKFDDTRHAAGLDLSFGGSRSRLTLSAGGATERDYSSLSFGSNADIDLPGKNTNLALSYTHNLDEVCDRDNSLATPFERRPLTGVDPCRKKSLIRGRDILGTTLWRPLDIDTAQATLTQNLSPTMALQANLYGQVLRGYQANPYRRVRVRGVEPQESVPNVRGRVAALIRLNRYVETLNAAAHASLRGYSDTWGVNAVDVEMGWSQYFGDNLLLRTRGRIYQQTEAVFFKDAFYYDTEGAAGEYFTGDRELGAIRNVVAGTKLSYVSFDPEGGSTWGVFDEVQLQLKGDLYFFEQLPADPIEDNRDGIDSQFLTGSSVLDAFVLQVALLLNY